MKTRTAGLGVAGVLLLAGLAAANVVTEWNDIALDAVKTARLMSPPAARALAIVHASIFDAVNAVEQEYEPYLVDMRADTSASADAAAVAAAHGALLALFPAQEAALAEKLDDSLDQFPDDGGKTAGIALGQEIAASVIALRMNDGAMNGVPYTPGTLPGEWRPTPPGYMPAMMPHWGNVTPFATFRSKMRIPRPPQLRSAKYAKEVATVAALGAKNNSVRTPEQTALAMFWVDMPGTITTVGRWNKVAQAACSQRNLSVSETARLFALLNIAQADAGIAVWDNKFTYNFWRPITAIREADTDGNSRTVADPAWEPLATTPAFPEYASAHSAFSAAAAEVLTRCFGRKPLPFDIEAFDNPAMTRSFATFHAAAQEAGISRIYGGIHFDSGNRMGLLLGKRIAGRICGCALRAARGRRP